MKKFLAVVAIVLVVLFAARNPSAAAGATKGVGTDVVHVMDGLGSFASALTSGKK